jgi:RNA polymerase sigma-70 factor, ECF subfamily
MDKALDDDRDCANLIERVADGDRAALAGLFRLEAGRLIAVARRIVRRTELAEEIVQDAFVAVWEKARLFDRARGSARGWLATIVRNRALNLVRDGARMEFHDHERLAAFGDAGGDADEAYAALPEADDLKRCLSQLPAERRRSILLAYVVGFTHGEIAARLKAPVGTVKAWIRRGVVALQECMS